MRFRTIVSIVVVSSASFAQAQTSGGLAALVESGVEGPVIVADLVRFKPDGEARYKQYDDIAEKKVISLGGEYVFRGSAKVIPGIENKWDRLTLRKYPSVEAVMEMGSSTEYRGAFPHRMASVAESFVYAFSGELPAILGSDARDAMKLVPAPKTDDAVYMLNLLRFKEDGGELKYFREYGASVTPMIAALDGSATLNLKGIGPVIANESVDRLILVRYPSVEAFRDMIMSEAYQKVAHLRTESIEVGLLFPFSFQSGDTKEHVGARQSKLIDFGSKRASIGSHQ